jgi:methylmalonyl-CoA mutase
VIGLNRYRGAAGQLPEVNVVRTPRAKQQRQLDRLEKFKRRHRAGSERALDRLAAEVEKGGNVFAELIHTVEHCSLGQITGRLQGLVGCYRPMV